MKHTIIKAFIFDLDGVIVDTAKYHFLAWRRLANSLGFDFDEKKNEELKGISRMESLDRILAWGGIILSGQEKEKLAAEKNSWYGEYIMNMSPGEILEGALPFLEASREAGIRLGLGSASKNAMTILKHIGLVSYFETVIDGTKTTRSKPDPEVFELGAAAMKVAHGQTIVFEDAASGIEAALRGGFYAVGIGKEEVLGAAHLVIPNFIGWNPGDLIRTVLAGN